MAEYLMKLRVTNYNSNNQYIIEAKIPHLKPQLSNVNSV